MDRPLDLMKELTNASASTRNLGRGKGRLLRTPKYEAPKARSSRPKSDVGYTFHFAHKSLSKRNDISESSGNATSASAHQGYIERREAASVMDDSCAQELSSLQKEWNTVETQDKTSDVNDATLTTKKSRYKKAKLHYSSDRVGFGTIGDTTADRKKFWTKVEMAERRHGRVQSRIITELPYEATDAERIKIAGAFCKELDRLGLPFWATIHTPSHKNDKRNYHLHIAYYDRPANVDDNGNWDFEEVQSYKLKNRTTKTRRPYQQNKPAEIRARDWVKKLRKHFAEVSNSVLEQGGYEKRLDARSYKESGVSKEPTKHLGFKANAMEKFGLETSVGQDNSKKEIRWKINQRTKKWDRALATEDVFGFFMSEDLSDSFFEQSNKRRTQIEEGRGYALKSVHAEILADQIILRVDARKSFLDQEGKKLLLKGRGYLVSHTLQDIMTLTAESQILETRSEDIIQMTNDLNRVAKEEERKENIAWAKLEAPNTQKTRDIFGTDIMEDFDLFGSSGPVSSTPTTMIPVQSTDEKETVLPLQEADDFFTIDNDDFLDLIPDNKGNTAPSSPVYSDVVDIPAGPENVVKESVQTTNTTQIENPQSLPSVQPQLQDWAFLVERLNDKESIQKLDKQLLTMSNKDIRIKAIATRDLVDFLDDGTTRESANRGWIVLKSEAARRGVDLETGRQNLGKATDPQRARVHRDEYLESVLEVRQEVIKIRGR